MLSRPAFLILYFINGFIAALCLPVGAQNGILLVIKAPSGHLLPEVTVYDRKNFYSPPNERGEIPLAKPGKVVFIKQEGYRPQALITEKLTGRVEVILEDEAKSEWLIPTCKDNDRKRKAVWGRLSATIPAGAKTRKGADIDYADQTIFYGKERKYWLYGIDGPNASYGFPADDWILSAQSFSARSWWPVGFGSQGVDFRGQSMDGKYWRFIGTFGTAISYYDASKEAAAFFDRILDSICFQALY